ncbi:MAG: ABC transporter permease subunit [Rhodothermia bacterium]
MRFVLTMLSPVLLAFYASWSAGIRWVELPIPAVPSALVAVLAVIIVVPESFAGERERHTLETLLSTRLSDASIVFGKMLVAIFLAMALVVVVLLLGLLTVNIFHYDGEILLYTMPNLLFSLFVSIIASTMVTAIGVLISLKSETVQESTQTLAGAILVPPVLLGMMILVFRDEVVQLIMTVDRPLSAGATVTVLVVVTLGLVGEARRRFKRSGLLDG